jgi:hypothetical protein
MAFIKVVDWSSQIASSHISELEKQEMNPEATLSLTLPNGASGDVALPPIPLSVMAVADMLAEVEKGPVMFPDEPDDNATDTVALLLYSTHVELFGERTPIQEFDAIALVDQRDKVLGTHVCTGYDDGNFTLLLKESRVRIFERRTGKLRSEHVFEPSNKCPLIALRFGGKDEGDSPTPTDDIRDWVRSQVKQ